MGERAGERGWLARTKARRIKQILRDIHATTGKLDLGFLRRMSDDEVIAYLLALDGVGIKTAACPVRSECDLGRSDEVPQSP